MNGKGDKRRPTDENRFRENFDLIEWGRLSHDARVTHDPDPIPQVNL